MAFNNAEEFENIHKLPSHYKRKCKQKLFFDSLAGNFFGYLVYLNESKLVLK